jgi:hypothetical protein
MSLFFQTTLLGSAALDSDGLPPHGKIRIFGHQRPALFPDPSEYIFGPLATAAALLLKKRGSDEPLL